MSSFGVPEDDGEGDVPFVVSLSTANAGANENSNRNNTRNAPTFFMYR